MKTVILYLIIILNNGNDYELLKIISYENLYCFDWYEKNIEFLDNNNQRGVTFQGKLAIVKENTQKSTRRLRKNEKIEQRNRITF